MHPEDHDLVWGLFKDRLARKFQPPQYDFRIIRKDGSVVWLQLFASRIIFNGMPAIPKKK